MDRKITTVVLDCGLSAGYRTYKDYEYLEISLKELYNGYDTLGDGPDGPNTFLVMSKLFAELHAKGYRGDGINIIPGYYDSVAGLTFEVSRKIKKITKTK